MKKKHSSSSDKWSKPSKCSHAVTSCIGISNQITFSSTTATSKQQISASANLYKTKTIWWLRCQVLQFTWLPKSSKERHTRTRQISGHQEWFSSKCYLESVLSKASPQLNSSKCQRMKTWSSLTILKYHQLSKNYSEKYQSKIMPIGLTGNKCLNSPSPKTETSMVQESLPTTQLNLDLEPQSETHLASEVD